MIRRTGTTRNGMDRGGNGRAMAGRVLWELAGQRGRLILVTGDRHEPTSHELTSPDPPARPLTNLPGDVPAVLPPSRFLAVSASAAPGRRASRGPRSSRSARNLSASSHPRPRDV